MQDKAIINKQLTTTEFSFFTKEEVQAMSVQQIYTPIAFDHLFRPLSHGLYDPLLGISPYDHLGKCPTCGLGEMNCPGHLGHIELTAPVYNPFLIVTLHKIMKSKCLNCHKFKLNDTKRAYFTLKLKLIKLGLITSASRLIDLLDVFPSIMPPKPAEGSVGRERTRTGSGSMKSDTENIEVTEIAEPILASDPRAEELKAIIAESETKAYPEETTSAMQKALKDCNKEFFGTVRASKKCPQCHAINCNIKRDGYTKFFKIPLSEKDKSAMKVLGIGQDDILYEELVMHTDSELGESDIEKDDAVEKVEEEEKQAPQEDLKQVYLHPLEVREHIIKLWRCEKELAGLLFGKLVSEKPKDSKTTVIDSSSPDLFFIHALAVPPNRFRPESKGDGDDALLHRHTVMLTRILNINLALKDMLIEKTPGKAGTEGTPQKSNEEIKKIMEVPVELETPSNLKALSSTEIVKKWIELQDSVNQFLDSSKAGKSASKEGQGIRQLLERKEGLFRMKMMGKRVNFAARSVISPDPYIDTGEIGIPQFMAKKLTYPESVAEFNAAKMRQLVINGPEKYPGANIVEDENKIKTLLSGLTEDQRKAIAKTLTSGRKTVYRHMENGDIMMLNRQPTLHKPSIMGHKARILPKEQTIRMHYTNCASYNADFDGDEMNAHLVQSHFARAEGYGIMATDYQYIVPTNGKPIRGLIQDCIVSSVYLTSRDTLMTKDMYQQLIFVALHNVLYSGFIPEVILSPPCIKKPKEMWSGKQVVTTILKSLAGKAHLKSGLNITSKSKLPASVWGEYGKEEAVVTIRDNELLTGVLDKAIEF